MRILGRGSWGVGAVLGLVGAAAAVGCSDGAKEETPKGADVVVVARSTLSRDLAPKASAADVAELVNGATRFAFDLYPLLTAKNPNANFTYSPYSLSLALALAYAGTGGETASQMATALHFTLPPERLHPAFDALDLALTANQTKDFQLHVADALWADQTLPILPGYLDTLATNYGAGVKVVDFLHAPAAAVAAINQWANEATNGEIKNVLDSVPPGTLLTLANAIYFDAKWQTPFDKGSTSGAPFTRLDGTTVSAATMSAREGAPYAETADYQAIDLPYKGGNAAMTVVLPKPGRDAAVAGALGASWYAELVQSYAGAEVALGLPKFDVAPSVFSAAPALQALGVTDAFGGGANFSKLSASPLQLFDVQQTALVRVDEEGTVAAAVTVATAGSSNVVEDLKTMTVNRPFFFFLRSLPSNAILFVGRVTDPTGVAP